MQSTANEMLQFLDSPIQSISPPVSHVCPSSLHLLHASLTSACESLMMTPVRVCGSESESEVLIQSSDSPDSTSLEVDEDDDDSTETYEEKSTSDLEPDIDRPSFSPISLTSPASLSPQNHTTRPPKSATAGYKIVFDNIDKTVVPKHLTAESQVLSLHYVQAYAVRDRLDFSSLPNHRSGDTNLFQLLPSQSDYKSLKELFITHVSRVIVDHLAFFNKDFKGLVKRHIPHKYSFEHSMKSEVVSIPQKIG